MLPRRHRLGHHLSIAHLKYQTNILSRVNVIDKTSVFSYHNYRFIWLISNFFYNYLIIYNFLGKKRIHVLDAMLETAQSLSISWAWTRGSAPAKARLTGPRGGSPYWSQTNQKSLHKSTTKKSLHGCFRRISLDAFAR